MRSLVSLFAAVAILLAGHGLQIALVPLRAAELGWTTPDIASAGAFYFIGFLAGCLLIPRLIARAGHIRVFSVTTTLCGASLIGLLYSHDFWHWVPLRTLFGFAISGAYLIVESWLSEAAPDGSRGRVLAGYTIVVLISMVVGQAFLPTAPADSDGLLLFSALLVSLAVIPVSLTRSEQPAPVATIQLDLGGLFRQSPAAAWTALASGLLAGSLWTLLPVFGKDAELNAGQIAGLSAAFILGGAALQGPLGHLSDRTDRRRVLAGVLVLAIGAAILTALTTTATGLIASVVISGGILLTLYPIALSHANDRSQGNFLAIGTAILLLNSLGSVVGPLVAAQAMQHLGPSGLFTYLAAVEVLLLAYLAVAMVRRDAEPHAKDFLAVTKTSQAAFDLDPRADDTASSPVSAKMD